MTFTSLTRRLPSLSLLLTAFCTLLLTSCSGRSANGTTTFAGIIYLVLAVMAVISLLKQDWSLGKKLLWGAIIWFFPFLGSIAYFLFSGRQ